jgi:hypothetical protein
MPRRRSIPAGSKRFCQRRPRWSPSVGARWHHRNPHRARPSPRFPLAQSRPNPRSSLVLRTRLKPRFPLAPSRPSPRLPRFPRFPLAQWSQWSLPLPCCPLALRSRRNPSRSLHRSLRCSHRFPDPRRPKLRPHPCRCFPKRRSTPRLQRQLRPIRRIPLPPRRSSNPTRRRRDRRPCRSCRHYRRYPLRSSCLRSSLLRRLASHLNCRRPPLRPSRLPSTDHRPYRSPPSRHNSRGLLLQPPQRTRPARTAIGACSTTPRSPRDRGPRLGLRLNALVLEKTRAAGACEATSTSRHFREPESLSIDAHPVRAGLEVSRPMANGLRTLGHGRC